MVGDYIWLKHNYNFSKISRSIDELIVLDVSRGVKSIGKFAEILSRIASECFVPISAGGGIKSIQDAKLLFRSGADKVVVNTKLFSEDNFLEELSREYGSQALVGAMDFKITDSKLSIYVNNGSQRLISETDILIEKLLRRPIGELYLNSMDRDGTGQGLDFRIVEFLPKEIKIPLILAGGIGNEGHIVEGLSKPFVDAVATANLFNFIGEGLTRARELAIKRGIKLPLW
jgi:cyclase